MKTNWSWKWENSVWKRHVVEQPAAEEIGVLSRWRKGEDGSKWKKRKVAPFEMWQQNYRKASLKKLLQKKQQIGDRFAAKLERRLVNYIGTQREQVKEKSAAPMDEYFRLLVDIRKKNIRKLRKVFLNNLIQSVPTTQLKESHDDVQANNSSLS